MPTYGKFSDENESIFFNYGLSNEATGDFQIHYHDFFEIYYFIEGDVDYLVEGKKYHPAARSLILLSPHIFHGVRVNTSENYRRFVLQFHPNIIEPEHRTLLLSAFPGSKNSSGREVYYGNTDRFKLYPFFEALADCCNQSEELTEKLFTFYIKALLSQLTLMCSSLRPQDSGITVSDTMADVITYLNDHLSEKITLDSLSEHFFISKHYLNRAFRKATGTTVYDYLIYKRVIYAKQLLMNGMAASEASLHAGFTEYSAFYRAYLKITGHAPQEDMKIC